MTALLYEMVVLLTNSFANYWIFSWFCWGGNNAFGILAAVRFRVIAKKRYRKGGKTVRIGLVTAVLRTFDFHLWSSFHRTSSLLLIFLLLYYLIFVFYDIVYFIINSFNAFFISRDKEITLDHYEKNN